MNEMQYSCECQVHGHILPQNISVQLGRNTLSVAEVVQESSTRNSEIVPGHSKQPSWRLRINPKIKTGCGQAESRVSFMDGIGIVPKSDVSLQAVSSTKNILPLREIVPLAQGFALFKKRGST